LGDVLLALPFLAALPEHFRCRSLSLVGNPSILELLANQPFVAEVRDHDQAGWSGLYLDPPRLPDRLGEFIRGHRAGVVLAAKPEDPALAGLKQTGLAPVIWVPSRPPADRPVHLTDHMFAATGVKPCRPFVLVRPSAPGLEQAGVILSALGLENRRWLALHPGSGAPVKNWPIENWLSLAGEIEKELELPGLFILGPAEVHLVPVIEKFLGRTSRTRLVHSLPLPAAAGLLCYAEGYVGHDSGATHLAASLGRPILALFGPTNPAHWAPRGPRVSILALEGFGSARPWSGLTPRRIIDELKGLWGSELAGS